MSPAKRKILSCGAVIVRMTDDEPLFLMLRAFRHWDFPKGVNEAGETPEETMVREISEETEITDLRFPWGKDYIETGPYNRGKIARYYIAATESEKITLPVNDLLGRPEHSEYRWVTLAEARELASPRVARVLDWAGVTLHVAG